MRLLVFEPRLEGHHLSWLRYVTEDLLHAGHHLTLAIDGRSRAAAKYHEHLGDLLNRVSTVSLFNAKGRLKGGNRLSALGECFAHSGAQHAFVNNLDDIASSMLRHAAAGGNPPPNIRGKLSGVYFRPRFLANPFWPPGNIFKQIGFNRLARHGWFHRVCLVDEYLHQKHRNRYPDGMLAFLPDTWSGNFSMPREQAREKFGIGVDNFVFLHYGIGTRRKGLHLVVQAMQSSICPDHWHLLCAGQLSDDKKIANGVSRLAERGRATVLNRYVSKAEEHMCFAATDTVLLPYVRHFGSSGVLALAAAAGKMVIASDEGLIAHRVREKGLGLCFPSGNVQKLKQTLAEAEQGLRCDPQRYANPCREFAEQCNREAFRKAISAVYTQGDTKPGSGDMGGDR